MVNLSREELDFLIELQHEMLTQDTVCQAAPRFWVVQDKRSVPTDEDYSDGYEIYDDNGCDTVASSMEEFIRYVNDKYGEHGVKIFYMKDQYPCGCAILVKASRPIDECETLESLKKEYDENENTDIDEILDYLQIEALIDELSLVESIYEQFRVVYTREEEFIAPNTMFLTNRAAKKHIEENDYHYHKDAHSYAMTAWRSPEVEQLWAILDKINWQELKEEKYGKEKRPIIAEGV